MGSSPTAATPRPATGPLTGVDLRDGTPALIWPLLDTDRDLLQRGYAELSPASRRSRFLTELPELSEQLLRLLVDDVDGDDHVAVLLTVLPAGGGARPVGVARLVRDPDHPAAADVAVTVLDAWQGRGVGAALLAAVLARRPADISMLRTTVAAENRSSLAMLAQGGRLTTRRDGGGVLTVEVTGLPAVDALASA
jgi:GNAT superfamily N-acetyltransferase